MNKGVKIGLIVVVVIGLAVGGYLIYKKTTSNSEDLDVDENNSNDNPNRPTSNGQSNDLPPTVFQNKYQGDFFRIWVNREYPKYAKEIDLGVKGDFNNSYIRKAWKKYGTEFLKTHDNILALTKYIPAIFYEKALNKNYSWRIVIDEAQLGTTSIGFQSDGVWINYNSNPTVSGKWWDGGKQASCDKYECGSVANLKANNFLQLAEKIVKTYKFKKSSFDGSYGL